MIVPLRFWSSSSTEGLFVSTHDRSFLLAVLLPVCLLVGAFPVVQAQNAGSASRWSDPATWPNRTVPVAGDTVTIPEGTNVVLDVTPPALGGLTIDGTLSFANTADVELTTEWIVLHGELAIGTEARPHTRKATITFTNTVPDEEPMKGMGDRGIMIMGGTLNLHGDRKNAWTKLSQTAEAGSTVIQVLDAAGWRAGDEIVLASTDFDPRQAERRTIASIRGNAITLDRKLDYMHFGKITFGVDERGEVGLLTRNIKLQASADAEKSFQGGHVMAMGTSKMFVEGVELNRMGQHMTLARYPIHWHLIGDAKGQYIKNASIHDTYNRCVTVHGTNFLRVENNVTYNIVGHCFFLEDGIEHGNQFVKNLAIQIKCHPSKACVPTNLAANGENRGSNSLNRATYRADSMSGKDTLLPSDNTVTAYWITNPDNVFIDNVAAGSDENGFWWSLPEHPIGKFEGTEISKATWPRRTRMAEFRGNVAHSNFDGFMMDRNINAENVFGLAGPSHIAREHPANENSKGVESLLENLTAYKNRNGGAWGRGELHVFKNFKAADNAIGFTNSTGSFGADTFTSLVVDSLFVGETDNIGNPVTPEEKAYGRSLPKPQIPDFPIRAYEYYDYRHDVVNTTFVNFQDNKQRGSGALSWLLYTGAGVTTENTVKSAKYINAKPVYFPKIDTRFDGDNRSGSAYRTAAIHDIDGSTTGIPDSYVLIHDGENNSVATDDTCKIQPSWNASVCAGDIGRLQFSIGRGGARSGLGLALKDVALRGAGPARGGGPAGAAGPARGAGPGRGAGPAPAAAPQQPITLSRNGKDFKITANQSTVRAGTEIRVKTERPEVAISLTEMAKDSWVVFELPGFANATSGKQQDSLDALRKATETSYFKGPDAVWVKLVIPTAPKGVGIDQFGPLDTQTSITVRR